MTYSIIQPPFTLQFREMSKNDLRAYNAWFHKVMAERLVRLADAVRSTEGYVEWAPDLTADSLDNLGRWFEHEVETRSKSTTEIDEEKANLLFPVAISDTQLTNRTFSLAIDIGMYFGRVVLEEIPGTTWSQELRAKRSADYGQPIIVGLGKVSMNPVRLMITGAYSVARSKKPVRLRQLFETWKNMHSETH